MSGREFEELNTVNEIAMEQINRLKGEGERRGAVPPFQRPKGDFWGSDHTNPSWRPSSNAQIPKSSAPLLGGTPRSYYTHGGYRRSGDNYYSSPDVFYKKMLSAIYRNNPTKQDETQENKEGRIVDDIVGISGELSIGGSLFLERSLFPERQEDVVMMEVDKRQPANITYRKVKSPSAMVSRDTKNQLFAIVLSGFTKVATTMVLNWAKEKEVPEELL